MPIIGRHPGAKHLVPFVGNLDVENNETLYAYAQFIRKPPAFVLNRLISTVLAMDPDYCAWREQHRESFAPQRAERRPPARRPNGIRGRERSSSSADDGRDA